MEPMSSIRQYYYTLGVEPGVSAAELKEAYRALVKECHPDRHAHNPEAQQRAEERTKVINEAYSKLRRYRRDMQPRIHAPGSAPPHPMRPASHPVHTRPSAPPPPSFDSLDSTFFQHVNLDAEIAGPPPGPTSTIPPQPDLGAHLEARQYRKMKGPAAAVATVALALVLGLGIGGFTGWLVGGTEAIANGAVAMGSLLATIAAVVGGMGLFVNGR